MEKLHDEVEHFGRRAALAGNSVFLEAYTGHVHVFQLAAFAKGAKIATRRATSWIQFKGRGIKSEFYQDTNVSQHTLLDFDGRVVMEEPPMFLLESCQSLRSGG